MFSRPRYQYAREFAPALEYPLQPDEVIAHLREHLAYHGHNHLFYRARCTSLAAEVADLRARVSALVSRVSALESGDAA